MTMDLPLINKELIVELLRKVDVEIVEILASPPVSRMESPCVIQRRIEITWEVPSP